MVRAGSVTWAPAISSSRTTMRRTDCSTSSGRTAACTWRETSSNACNRATCCCRSITSAWLLEKEEGDIAEWHQSSTALGALGSRFAYSPDSNGTHGDLFGEDILEKAKIMETKLALPVQ